MSEQVHAPSGNGGKLLVAIVGREQGEKIVALTKNAGARGGTILLGKGTAESSLLQLLGIGDSEKDLVLTLAPEPVLAAVLAVLQNDPWARKKARGVALVLDVTTILRHALAPAGQATSPAAAATPAETPPSLSTLSRITPPVGENAMQAPSHELISVIVNAGYAEDIMHAARKAGATGGTIINARGTGKEEDVKFFGITIVPEKDFLLILAAKDQAQAILEAIRATPCLSEPGMGIAFCINVECFVPLGK